MHVWAEVLDRPRFQKPTQIAQARYARSPIAQMDSVSQLRSHRASSGIFCSSFASSRLGGKVFASQYKRSGFADQEGSANLRRTKTLCSFCVLLRFLHVLRLRAVRASRSMAFLALLASQSVQRIDTQRAPRRHETGSNGHAVAPMACGFGNAPSDGPEYVFVLSDFVARAGPQNSVRVKGFSGRVDLWPSWALAGPFGWGSRSRVRWSWSERWSKR